MTVLDLLITHKAWLTGCTLALIASALTWAQRDQRLDKIDGPKGSLLVGIGLSLPPRATNLLREWATRYGEVYKIRVGWYYWVVLNSPAAIKGVFDKQVMLILARLQELITDNFIVKSISTSSKMPAPMGELVVGGMRMLTMPYGPKWRAYRTIVHQLLSPKMTEAFVPSQTLEIKQLLYDLAHDNGTETEFYYHVRRMFFSILMTLVYGRRIDRGDHEDVSYSEQSGKLLGKIGKAGTFIEDEIPPLAKLPHWMQLSRRRALKYAKQVLWAKMRVWNILKEQLASGTAPPCFAKELMRTDYRSLGLVEEDVAWIAGGLVEAGSQTSFATLTNLILYLAADQAAQARAHKELRAAVGDSYAPKFDDLARLPFIRACVKEILRLCPAPPWILRHYTDNDVVYKNYTIPKGTAIVGNTTAIHFDPVRYPDPISFKPERYTNHTKYSAEYAAMGDPYERDHFAFGAGRRICPGSRVAENALALSLANILWAFEIRPPTILIDGKEQDAEMDFSDDVFDEAPLRAAKPFKARFLPRSRGHLQVIEESWSAALKAEDGLRGTTENANRTV